MGYPRYESAETSERAQQDEELQAELLRALIHRKLNGAVQQTLDMDPNRLPLRELPPGDTASLFMLYLAWNRVSMTKPCCKSTFYVVAKAWRPCLRFRARSEHALCVTCQRLKAAIGQADELHLVVPHSLNKLDWYQKKSHKTRLQNLVFLTLR